MGHSVFGIRIDGKNTLDLNFPRHLFNAPATSYNALMHNFLDSVFLSIRGTNLH